jgi:polar amino acid transport system substrate-binding protein
MRKTVTVLSLLALLGAAFAVVGSAGASRHAAKGTAFSYCDDPTFPPMESTTTAGKPVGFDIDMADAIAKQLGGTPKFLHTAFSGLLPALGAKKCDVALSGIFVTPDRTKQFPAVPYMRSHRALLVAGGNPKHITSVAALKGKRVAVQAGTKYEQYLKAQKKKLGFSLQSYPGDTDAIAQLLLGRADAVLTQDTEGAYQMKQHPGKIAIGYLFPSFDTFGIYYRKGDAIGAKMAAAIKALKADGTLGKLAAKYSIPAGDVK